MRIPKFIVILIVILNSFIIYPQSGWFDINANISDDLKSIFFTDSINGYICGNSGRMLKTINGGQSWDTLTTLNYNNNLASIYFVNSLTGFIAGSYCIYKTTNSGITWVFSSAFNNFYAFKIVFTNQNTGFAVGQYKMAKTTDSGFSWNFTSYSNDFLVDIFFINGSTGYLVKDPPMSCEILKTTNTGIDWFYSYFIDCYSCRSVHHPNEINRYIIGADCYSNNFISRMFGTSNGGLFWYSTELGDNKFYSIFFTSGLTGYTAGDNGIILKTTNGGLNWHNQTSGIGGPILYQILFLNENTGFAIGGNGKIKKTTNGGGSIGIKVINSEIPQNYNLHQNYPNPFNPNTRLRFEIPVQGKVKLIVYDILGREIKILVNDKLYPGIYEVQFDGTNYPSGIYFCKMISGNYSQTIKLILIK